MSTKPPAITCSACRGEEPRLSAVEARQRLSQLDQQWQLIDDHHLERTYSCKNFSDALALVDALAKLAEVESHHPEIHLAWGRVRVTIWSYAVDGLTETDFAWAAKADALAAGRRAHDAGALYKVIANCEDVYAVWPADRGDLPTWRTVSPAGTLADCQSFIAAIEQERHSAVLRRKLEHTPVWP